MFFIFRNFNINSINFINHRYEFYKCFYNSIYVIFLLLLTYNIYRVFTVDIGRFFGHFTHKTDFVVLTWMHDTIELMQHVTLWNNTKEM
jgi:hypothetical protein